jgi:hypothetical protein
LLRHQERYLPDAIQYTINVEKDGHDVTATYDMIVPDDGSASIASFNLKVDGKELIDQEKWVPVQSRFDGTQFAKLVDTSKDVTVSFSISSNEDWTAENSDTLQG